MTENLMKLKHLSISTKLTLDLFMSLFFIIALGFRSTGSTKRRD